MAYINPFSDHLDNESLLETLYWHYKKSHVICDEQIKRYQKMLSDTVHALSLGQQEAILGTVNLMCETQEQQAFLAGMRLGARLALEIKED